MKFVIPGNLDIPPDDWQCFRVLWPNTAEWRSILAGLLYLVARGRSWNEETGSVLAARDYGALLFDANVPLVKCAGGVEQVTNEQIFAAMGGGDGEEIDMWSVTDVTIDADGQLVLHYGPCCTKVVGSIPAVVKSSAASGTIDPETGQPIGGGEVLPPGSELTPFSSACGKASAIIDLMSEVAAALVQHANNPLTMMKNLSGDFPGIKFNSLAAVNAVLQWGLIKVLSLPDPLLPEEVNVIWDEDAVFDADRKQRWKCLYARRFNDDFLRPSDSKVREAGDLAGTVFPLAVGTFWNWILQTIGEGDLANAAVTGAMVAADCACPEAAPQAPYTIPTSNGWYLSPIVWEGDVQSAGGLGTVHECINFTTQHDTYGMVFSLSDRVSGSAVFRAGNPDCILEGSTAIIPDTSQVVASEADFFAANLSVMNEIQQQRGGLYAVQLTNIPQDKNGVAWIGSGATGNFAGGVPLHFTCDSQFNEAREYHVAIRLLYNINSTSHQ